MQLTDTLQVRAEEADALERVLINKEKDRRYNGLVSYSRGEEETLKFGTPSIPDTQIVIFTVTVKSFQVLMDIGELLGDEKRKEARNG